MVRVHVCVSSSSYDTYPPPHKTHTQNAGNLLQPPAIPADELRSTSIFVPWCASSCSPLSLSPQLLAPKESPILAVQSSPPPSSPLPHSPKIQGTHELDASSMVELHSLKVAPEHNGQKGKLVECSASDGRWSVEMPAGGVLALKPVNLRLPSEKDQEVEEVAPQAAAYLHTRSSPQSGSSSSKSSDSSGEPEWNEWAWRAAGTGFAAGAEADGRMQRHAIDGRMQRPASVGSALEIGDGQVESSDSNLASYSIGLLLEKRAEKYTVKDIATGGVADKNGLVRQGDILESVNDEDVRALSLEEIHNKIRQESLRGTPIRLQLVRQSLPNTSVRYIANLSKSTLNASGSATSPQMSPAGETDFHSGANPHQRGATSMSTASPRCSRYPSEPKTSSPKTGMSSPVERKGLLINDTVENLLSPPTPLPDLRDECSRFRQRVSDLEAQLQARSCEVSTLVSTLQACILLLI